MEPSAGHVLSRAEAMRGENLALYPSLRWRLSPDVAHVLWSRAFLPDGTFLGTVRDVSITLNGVPLPVPQDILLGQPFVVDDGLPPNSMMLEPVRPPDPLE